MYVNLLDDLSSLCMFSKPFCWKPRDCGVESNSYLMLMGYLSRL